MNEIAESGKNAASEIELNYRRYLVKVCMLIGLPFLAYFSVYDIIIDVLKDELIDQPSEYEHILKRIHGALEKRWQIEGSSGDQ